LSEAEVKTLLDQITRRAWQEACRLVLDRKPGETIDMPHHNDGRRGRVF
jgi:hypothetical protein